ncbi:hypothetical protein V6N13_082058 [Hibiscus sabdariffa]
MEELSCWTVYWVDPNFQCFKKIGRDVFSFANLTATARDWVLENGPRHIQNKPLVLRKWEPNLAKLNFGLSYIAGALGTPLYMDSITASRERLEYAKVYVEIGVDSEIPKHINLVLRNGSTNADHVYIPWLPPRCKAKEIVVGELGEPSGSVGEDACIVDQVVVTVPNIMTQDPIANVACAVNIVSSETVGTIESVSAQL